MNDKLYQLAKKIDSCNYEHDRYGYLDYLYKQDDTISISEARKKEVDAIYKDLIKNGVSEYIHYPTNIIEEIESILQHEEIQE